MVHIFVIIHLGVWEEFTWLILDIVRVHLHYQMDRARVWFGIVSFGIIFSFQTGPMDNWAKPIIVAPLSCYGTYLAC